MPNQPNPHLPNIMNLKIKFIIEPFVASMGIEPIVSPFSGGEICFSLLSYFYFVSRYTPFEPKYTTEKLQSSNLQK